MYLNQYRTLKDNKVTYVNLKNASFAIKQGLCNGKIRYSIANTEITDPKVLEEIMNIANHKYEDFSLTEQVTYVRKLLLK